ncbi:MAG: SseB family protein, partial [Rubellimicrobium sp.]|nr:SseB family protein [Rubellimicrobium sp.]
MTELDAAAAAMEAAPGDDGLRLSFYARLAEGELFLLLKAEAEGDRIDPETVTIDGQVHLIAFDREERLATFCGRPAPYAGLLGRALAGMMAGQGLGLALNPDVAPSAMIIAPEALDWLAATLGQEADEADARIERIDAPRDLPEAVIAALDRKLATAAGRARAAYLAAVTYRDGGSGHVLAFGGARPEVRPALVRAVAEALALCGADEGAIDVTFLAPD